MPDRHVIKTSLTPPAKRTLDRVTKALGMKQQELIGRLIDWFGSQERLLQVLAVGQLDEETDVDVVDLLYRRRHPEIEESERLKMMEEMAREVAKQIWQEQPKRRRS